VQNCKLRPIPPEEIQTGTKPEKELGGASGPVQVFGIFIQWKENHLTQGESEALQYKVRKRTGRNWRVSSWNTGSRS